MKALLLRIKNVANDRVTRVLFYDQTLKKGYASLASFSNLFVLRRILVTLVAYPLSLMCWVFLAVLNHFKPVRIYRFERPQRPGFASVYIEQLEPLCRELQDSGNKGILIFIDASETTNLELLKLYASHFNLYLDDRSKFARTIFSLIPKIGFTNSFVKHSHYNLNWEFLPARNLKTSETTEVPDALRELDLKPMNYVLISYPSSSYYKEKLPGNHINLDRFIDPTNYVDALRLLTEQGLKIIRVGVDTEDLPRSLKDAHVYDLSGELRTDKQDLWLFEYCFFNWSMGAIGTWHFAHKFNRPSLVTDSYAHFQGYQCSLFTRKMVFDKETSRYLNFKEMRKLKSVLGKVQEMKSQQLAYIQNTPKQLCDAVEEILLFANGHELGSVQNTELLEKYDRIIVNSGFPIRKKLHSRPTISFLRDNQELLE